MTDAEFLDMLEARVVAAKIETKILVAISAPERQQLYNLAKLTWVISGIGYMGTLATAAVIADARKLLG